MKSTMPMSETMMYILFALREERHGYGIMQTVKQLTRGRVVLGAGTVYQTLAKLEKGAMILSTREEDRKKFYRLTEKGMTALREEVKRIGELYRNMEAIL